MAYLIALGILSLVGIVATLWLLRTDGYGPIPTDRSRAAAVAEPSTRSRTASEAAEARPATSAAPATAPLRIIGAD